MTRITHYYPRWYPNIGGIVNNISSIVSNMPDNYEFEIVTNAIKNYPLHEQFNEKTVITRVKPYDMTQQLNRSRKINKCLYPKIILSDLIRNQKKHKHIRYTTTDIIHLHGPVIDSNMYTLDEKFSTTYFSSSEDFSWESRPKILTLHGYGSLFDNNALRKRIEEHIVSQMDHIICVDEHIYNHVKKYTKNKKVFYIPNSVSTSQFLNKQDYTDKIIKKKKITIGFVGRIGEERGLMLLKNLIELKLPYIRICIAFSGDNRPINKFINTTKIENKEEIIIHRNVTPQEMPKFLSTIDVLFNPVLVEGISRATLEAMSCEKPVIMIKRGNRYPTIHKKTGFLIENNIECLQELIKEVHEDPDILTDMGKFARKIVVEEFDDKVIVPKIKDIYEKMLGENNA